jgi:hypothetical protein
MCIVLQCTAFCAVPQLRFIQGALSACNHCHDIPVAAPMQHFKPGLEALQLEWLLDFVERNLHYGCVYSCEAF